MASEHFIEKRDYVKLGGFAVWIAATTLMMLHNGENTYTRAATSGMQPFRAFIEAALTVLTIEVTGLYFLYAATKADITPAQRTVAGWSVGLSVALGFAINLLGGIEGAGPTLNILARGAQGVCLVLIARWHWVGHNGVDLTALVAQLRADVQQLQADNSKALHENGVVLQCNERLQSEHDALVAQLEQERIQHQDELREVARLATAQRVQQPAPQPAQLSSGMTWEQGVDALKAQGVDVTPTALGEIVGKHKSTAGRWLAQHPEVRS